ncbi:MAG: hypothetical protein LQ338_005775 [Usnochroma carphineum]|nr:MAG: hypothetical protein LQ338_005775 [Usnochroma carphineum]
MTTAELAATRVKMAIAIFGNSELQGKDCSPVKHILKCAVASDNKPVTDVPGEPFPFMKLPPEIRVMIFEKVLVASSQITVSYRSYWKSFYTTILDDEHGYQQYHSPRAACELFTVSKSFYNEAMPIYFGCNTFAVVHLDHLAFLSKLKADYRRSIRSISTGFSGIAPARCIKLLHGCISLRRLSLRITYGTMRYHKGKCLPLLKSSGVNDLLKIRDLEELEVERYPSFSPLLDERVEGWGPFLEALQVLKQPRDAASLRRQDQKDYPPEKAKRTVFGKTNVMTRSERKVTNKGSKDS